MTQATLNASASADTQLYRHVKRPEWGVGILVGEYDDARSYQFEDGQLRKIRKGYYKLIEPAQDLGDRAEHIRENLNRVVGAGNDADQIVVDAVCPFSSQVALFTRLYPGGFEDPEWISDHRQPSGAPLKRHRVPISTEAREVLSPSRCGEILASGKPGRLLDIVADLLARTDLVPVSHAKALRGLDSDEKSRYGGTLADLLHGERPYEERFKDHLIAHEEIFGARPSWRVATILPALVHPQDHVAVRRSVFFRQAGSVAPTARYTKRARVGSYGNFRRVAVGVRERLNAMGHTPRDLLDVHDFVWATLRTAALEHLGATEN